jgi:hypothetical protein
MDSARSMHSARHAESSTHEDAPWISLVAHSIYQLHSWTIPCQHKGALHAQSPLQEPLGRSC